MRVFVPALFISMVIAIGVLVVCLAPPKPSTFRFLEGILNLRKEYFSKGSKNNGMPGDLLVECGCSTETSVSYHLTLE